jgi:hypothetical protein
MSMRRDRLANGADAPDLRAWSGANGDNIIGGASVTPFERMLFFTPALRIFFQRTGVIGGLRLPLEQSMISNYMILLQPHQV